MEVVPDGDGAGVGYVVRFGGPLTLATTADLWSRAAGIAPPAGAVRVDVSGVPQVDSAGAALLLHVAGRLGDAPIESASAQVQGMLDVLGKPGNEPDTEARGRPRVGLIYALGQFSVRGLNRVRETVEYAGALTAGLLQTLIHPRSVRWKDVGGYVARSGAEAVGIVSLIGLLMGMILAFQMAAQMRQYGADLYVADIVALSLVRELGPLMTAIILAGRSGSAFAAEIGTMTVNEEVAALDTMGLERIRFLVLPKVIALLLVMPLLVTYADCAGIVGGFTVAASFLDQPVGVYFEHTIDRLALRDIIEGLVKGLSYAMVIASVGCLRGVQTQKGAQGVGQSATSAVVTAIFLVIVVDALLTGLFFLLTS